MKVGRPFNDRDLGRFLFEPSCCVRSVGKSEDIVALIAQKVAFMVSLLGSMRQDQGARPISQLRSHAAFLDLEAGLLAGCFDATVALFEPEGFRADGFAVVVDFSV